MSQNKIEEVQSQKILTSSFKKQRPEQIYNTYQTPQKSFNSYDLSETSESIYNNDNNIALIQ